MSEPQTISPTRPDTVPNLDTGDGDHDRFAHYVRKDDHMRGYVMGEEIEALCGKKWIPSRDPKRYPVCPTCKELAGRLFGDDGGNGDDGEG